MGCSHRNKIFLVKAIFSIKDKKQIVKEDTIETFCCVSCGAVQHSVKNEFCYTRLCWSKADSNNVNRIKCFNLSEVKKNIKRIQK